MDEDFPSTPKQIKLTAFAGLVLAGAAFLCGAWAPTAFPSTDGTPVDPAFVGMAMAHRTKLSPQAGHVYPLVSDAKTGAALSLDSRNPNLTDSAGMVFPSADAEGTVSVDIRADYAAVPACRAMRGHVTPAQGLAPARVAVEVDPKSGIQTSEVPGGTRLTIPRLGAGAAVWLYPTMVGSDGQGGRQVGFLAGAASNLTYVTREEDDTKQSWAHAGASIFAIVALSCAGNILGSMARRRSKAKEAAKKAAPKHAM